MAPAPKPPEPDPSPAPAAEPEWAASLRALIQELPSRLTATVTTDDKNGIAEHIVGLFESKGAFTRKDDPEESKDEPGDKPKTDPAGSGDPAPQQQDSLARRWFGRH